MKTRYQLHVEKWSNCTGCELHLCRKKVVIARGTIPADVLLIGEAPGISEDNLGIPFIGVAGKLLDQIISRAIPQGITYALTNLVSCIPLEPEGANKKKLAQPPDESIEACSERLLEIIAIVNPKLIVCVGKLAGDWLDPKWKNSIKLPEPVPMVEIVHPAHILRTNFAGRGLMIQRCEVTIRNGIVEHILDHQATS